MTQKERAAFQELLLAAKMVVNMRPYANDGCVRLRVDGDIMTTVVAAIEQAECSLEIWHWAGDGRCARSYRDTGRTLTKEKVTCSECLEGIA
jgi:hypothetical protein